MYKRQYYSVDHADNGDASSSSSSSGTDSDGSGDEQDDSAWPASDHESGSSVEEGGDGVNGVESLSDDEQPPESESDDEEWGAYRSSRGKEVQALDSSHFLSSQLAEPVEGTDKEQLKESNGDSMVLRVGGIMKCRLCVKTMCLSGDSMRAHLLSKIMRKCKKLLERNISVALVKWKPQAIPLLCTVRSWSMEGLAHLMNTCKGHARSVKQLASGKLKIQLGSDGEEEEEAETHTERLIRMRNLVEEKVEPVKRRRDSGRQRQRKRAKKKAMLAAKDTPEAELEAVPTVTGEMSSHKIQRTPKSSKSANGSDKKSPKMIKTPLASKVQSAIGVPKGTQKALGNDTLKSQIKNHHKAGPGSAKSPPPSRKDELRRRKSLH